MERAQPPRWIRQQMKAWGEWEDTTAQQYIAPENRHLFKQSFANKVYSVRIYAGKYPKPGAARSGNMPAFTHPTWDCLNLSITRIDEKPGIPWWIKMAIKDQLVGPEREAVEIYPPAADVLDPANIYYLIVLPPGETLGFHHTEVDQEPPPDATIRPKDARAKK